MRELQDYSATCDCCGSANVTVDEDAICTPCYEAAQQREKARREQESARLDRLYRQAKRDYDRP